MKLPYFQYHPDPLRTGGIVTSNDICECCNQARGYKYNSSIYSAEKVGAICPWCIADGSAAKKFNALFSDDYPLVEAGVPESIIEEVSKRTPGYDSWQQGVWQSHCNDACEFHGDASKIELEAIADTELEEFFKREMIEPNVWFQILAGYEPGGNPAVYKFVCRHCRCVMYTMDFT